MEDSPRQLEFNRYRRQGQDVVREDAREQQRSRADRGDSEAPQDALFAEGHQLHAQSPEAAHHGNGQDRRQHVGHGGDVAAREESEKQEQEDQRKDQAEKNKGAIAQRQAHADLGQCPGVSQSRRLLPVSSRKTSSSEGAAISRLESSLPCASRYFTRETMVAGTRVECTM